jgi:transcriptional regulator GlxA family with amidase domain
VLKTYVLALRDVPSMGTTGISDALRKADQAWAAFHPQQPALFDVRLIGLDHDPVSCGAGVWINPESVASSAPRPDLVVIPGLSNDIDLSIAANAGWPSWVARWATAGTLVASSCTGAFLAAEAGVLDGHTATTHWIAADLLQSRYPRVRVTAHRMVIDEDEVVTSGGATTFLNLVVHLTERFGGSERAALAAKLLLVDGHRLTQLPYAILVGTRHHTDDIVRLAQEHVAAQLSGELTVEHLAERAAVSQRSLERRFEQALGMSPGRYIQLARIETAKCQLETSTDTVEQIRRNVGYRDASAFRRAFARHTGESPAAYRRRYAGTDRPMPSRR